MKRKYTDEERITAIAAVKANGGNVFKTANELGIPLSTLRQWVAGVCVPQAVVIANQPSKKTFEQLAEHLEALAVTLSEAIPDRIQDANLTQVATALGIAIDKARLLREKPTQIITNQIDFSRYTTDQLRQIEAILDAPKPEPE